MAGGAEAKTLEDEYGTALTATLICLASEPRLAIPNFYATNNEALAALKIRAGAARREERDGQP